MPVRIADCPPLYVDLRDAASHHLLRGHPWETTPWEPREQEVMRRAVAPNSVAFDVGASIGLHSVLLSKLVGPNGRVCLFEPNHELHARLTHTVRGLGNATLYPYALSNESAEAVLFVPADHQLGSLAYWTDTEVHGNVRTLHCTKHRLDDLVGDGLVPRPDFIKCDVEGSELLVFKGARQTLNRRDAPTILFEANVYNARGFQVFVGDAKTFLHGLTVAHYHFFEVQSGGLLPIETVNPFHSNILAVPTSRLDRISGLP